MGLYVTGLVFPFGPMSARSRLFEQLVDDHTKQYWLNVSNGGSVVYNSTTAFTIIQRTPPSRTRAPKGPRGPRTLTVDLVSRQAVPPALGNTDSGTGKDKEEEGLFRNGTINNNFTIPTFPPTFEDTDDGVDFGGNGTAANKTNVTSQPTASPSISPQPSSFPSQLPSQYPTSSIAPSAMPSLSLLPSQEPSTVPEYETLVIWYRQTITYGEIFTGNDTRANNVEEIFEFPFLYDQLPFTNSLIEITSNQLAMFVEEVEVRDGSEAPSIQPSGQPSLVPSIAPSSAPSPIPQPAPDSSGGLSTAIVIVAVVVPVMLVLLLAFAGIIYVTRIDNNILSPGGSFEGAVIPLPLGQQDPGTPPGGDGPPPPPSFGGAEEQQAMMMPSSSHSVRSTIGTRTTQPLMEISEAMSMSKPSLAQPTLFDDEASSAASNHPMHYVSSPHRTPSYAGSMVSDMSIDSRRTSRNSGGTGNAFIPTLAPVPSPSSGSLNHSRASSYAGSYREPIAQSGLQRAATTGGVPRVSSSGRLSPLGQVSPFAGYQGGSQGGSQGGIPIIPTAQLSPPADGTSFTDGNQQAEAVSESESESDDPYAMTAFSMQIQDLDDDLDDLDNDF